MRILTKKDTDMKTLALLAALLISTTMACAQTTVKDVLGTMPPEVIPYINSDQRGEMNKFTIDNDTVVVKNTLNGTSTVTTIGDDFARLDLNKNTRLIIKLLPVSDSTQIICLVKSVRRPVPESVVEFYDTNWKVINNSFNLPDTRNAEAMLNELTARPDTMSQERFEELRKYIEPVVVRANIPHGGNTITFRLSVPFTTKEKFNEIKAILKKKSFKWDGKSFKNC